ncbi:hypothetical protein D3C80_2131680 [compost metagenome]
MPILNRSKTLSDMLTSCQFVGRTLSPVGAGLSANAVVLPPSHSRVDPRLHRARHPSQVAGRGYQAS